MFVLPSQIDHFHSVACNVILWSSLRTHPNARSYDPSKIQELGSCVGAHEKFFRASTRGDLIKIWSITIRELIDSILRSN